MSETRRIPIDSAARLFTVNQDGRRLPQGKRLTKRDAAGSFVRVLPEAEATDLELEGLTERLKEQGAAAVRVMPRAAADALQLGAESSAKVLELEPPRELLARLVAESSSEHKEELAALIEELADREGL